MTGEIEFYFDFGSSYSHLAQSKLEKLPTEKTEASIVYMPTSVMDLMKATGNCPTSLLRHIDLSFLLRDAIAANELGVGSAFASKVFNGLYAKSLNLGERHTLRDFLKENDLPGDQIIELMDTEETVENLKRRNKDAEEKGLFGLPTFCGGEEIFFGNDRLPFVEAAART